MAEIPDWRDVQGPWWRKTLIFLTAPFLLGGTALAAGYLIALTAEQLGAALKQLL